jgi:hypothetical protein
MERSRRQVPDTAIRPRWLAFLSQPRLAERKTDSWTVMPISGGNELGKVRWFAAWRKYCFFPSLNTVFDVNDLHEIWSFCEKQMMVRRVERFAS